MIATLDDILEFARGKLQEAKEGAEEIPFGVLQESYEFSEDGERRKYGGWDVRASAPSIVDVPKYSVLKHGSGLAAHAVILCVDLRGSSHRAVRIGAEDTYLTMHTYLPTMGHLVELADGKVIGLRGDGLFAGFGITEVDGDKQVFTQEIAAKATRNALKCGKGMIEAITDAINPVLEEDRIEGGLCIGVGIDVGKVVITRIGWESASEVTAYGPVINNTCKKLVAHASNSIHVSSGFRNIFPTAKGGRVRFRQVRGEDAFEVAYPDDVLDRTAKRRKAR